MSVVAVQDLNSSTRLTAQNAMTQSLSKKTVREIQTDRLKLGDYLGVSFVRPQPQPSAFDSVPAATHRRGHTNNLTPTHVIIIILINILLNCTLITVKIVHSFVPQPLKKHHVAYIEDNGFIRGQNLVKLFQFVWQFVLINVVRLLNFHIVASLNLTFQWD